MYERGYGERDWDGCWIAGQSVNWAEWWGSLRKKRKERKEACDDDEWDPVHERACTWWMNRKPMKIITHEKEDRKSVNRYDCGRESHWMII